jgi:hypothetical protein
MVLLALGAMSRIISIVSRMCAADMASTATAQSTLMDACEHQSEIDDMQAELLGRTEMVDLKSLIDAVCEGHKHQLDRCEYVPWATDNYRRLRLLTKHEVVGNVSKVQAQVIADTDKESRALLAVIARIPPASRVSAACAADWFLSRVNECLPQSDEVKMSSQNHLMQELINALQKHALVQQGFARLCSDGDIDGARAEIVQ